MSYKLYLGDCLEIMKQIPDDSVSVIISDPPYPDYYVDEYKYRPEIIDVFKNYNKKRQIIFWSAKVKFPLDYTAIHIWDKRVGCGSQYERIFERNGNKDYKVFSSYLINSTVAASYGNDVYTGHKSQKPISLMRKIVSLYTKKGDTVLDPFMGSGTTGVACVELGRNFIGIEQDNNYYEIAKNRIKETQMQPGLFDKINTDEYQQSNMFAKG